ncbi:MAG: hypothetical protein KAS32_00980 [Candidatus Peribacteraceae bacterium]|nr:hypothetical protein [Candidatus Peribacteraceae bacterium]
MVDDFDPHINYLKTKPSSDLPGYSIRDLSLDNYGEFQTPMKTFDMGGLSKETLFVYKNIQELKVIEKPLFIWNSQTWSALSRYIESGYNRSEEFLNISKFKPTIYKQIPNSIIASSVVFNRDPFRERITVYNNRKKVHPALDKDNFEMFLQNLYGYSRGFALVPDIKYGKISKNTPHIPKATPIISFEDYKDTIDYFTQIFSERNNKAIFVPIQTTFGKKRLNKLVEHYKKNNYSNIWVNFNGAGMTDSTLGGFRMIVRALDNAFGKNNYCLYSSHIKKEVSNEFGNEISPSFDMLYQYFGGNIIGCNRVGGKRPPDEEAIQKQMKKLGITDKAEYESMNLASKRRIFSPSTYYCHTPKTHPGLPKYSKDKRLVFSQEDLTNNLNKNIAIDNLLKYGEVESVKNYFANNNSKVKPYIGKKKMIVENKDIGDKIFTKDQPSLFSFDLE